MLLSVRVELFYRDARAKPPCRWCSRSEIYTGRNDMTLTRELLDTRYAWWFHNKRNAEQAKREILIIFSKELDDCFEWTEQDIYEQSRKIIFRWDNA